jgi:hypothetical protein
MSPILRFNKNVFTEAPDPNPPARKLDSEFRWENKGLPEKYGKNYLFKKNQILLINSGAPFYVLSETELLFWYQEKAQNKSPSSALRMLVVDLLKLAPITDNLNRVVKNMNDEGKTLYFLGDSQTACELSTTTIDKPMAYSFPKPIAYLNEILVPCHSSAIGEHNYYDKANLALLIIQPSKSRYQIFPQDWFNNGAFDFMYQGITNFERNLKTGKIHGEGSRIPPFILDSTFKNKI